MNKLKVVEIFDQTVQTKWSVESHGSIHIVINPGSPILHNDFFYWRLDDPKGWYLLSMDISEDGYLRMIEVITYNRKIAAIPVEVRNSNAIRKEVFLRIDTNTWIEKKKAWREKVKDSQVSEIPNWSENYKFIDNSEKFELQIDEKNLRIELFKDSIAQELWISRSLCLEINLMNEICGVLLKDFVGQDRKRLIRKFGMS